MPNNYQKNYSADINYLIIEVSPKYSITFGNSDNRQDAYATNNLQFKIVNY